MRAPPPWLLALEAWVGAEMAAMALTQPFLRPIGGGESAPVLILPGFTADDTSTVGLRSLLRAWGYWARGWDLGANLGATRELLAATRRRLDAVYERKGDESSASRLTRMLEHRFDPEFRRLAEHQRGALPVPSTDSPSTPPRCW